MLFISPLAQRERERDSPISKESERKRAKLQRHRKFAGILDNTLEYATILFDWYSVTLIWGRNLDKGGRDECALWGDMFWLKFMVVSLTP